MATPPTSSPTFSLTFSLNGAAQTVTTPPTLPLLHYLRRRGWVGTKEGCAEGDCGACTVALACEGGGYQAVNSCLVPMAAVAGKHVVTVEGLASGGAPLHPVQAALVREGGSQCGYCTPGIVMSLFAAYYGGLADGPVDDAALEGNLCRCTGYLPIRRAARSLESPPSDDPFGLPKGVPLTALHYQHNGQVFHRPTTLQDTLELLAAHPDATLIAGATDLGVDINKHHRHYPVLISLEALPELRVIDHTDAYLELGAGVTLRDLETHARGLFPALDAMLELFAARQIRNRATLGGNLATASPIGDLAPVLLALDATLELTSAQTSRWLPLSAFFTGYRRTALEPGELLSRVRIPKTLPHGATRRLSRAYKVGKRGTDDISIVAAAFTLDLGADERVVQARLAYGGVAATPVRAHAAESLLVGKTVDQATLEAVKLALQAAFTPLSDLRGSARYRTRLVINLFEKFVVGQGLLLVAV